ncbi:response regulator [Desulfonema ishimotonii]|uniref:Response regulator n=1 Tax=Desulfonema ishimotonii TaxID=45657 RepID=A0A401FUP2_9BACT|nr:response regulator [Desulfonema ishimotonii]GBC60707.1 response regulator [Desulfonema ishimotonii]
MKILIVDDEYLLRDVAQKTLVRYGECHTAVSGDDAVAAFEGAHEAGIPYDLIMMDVMMPESDGIETLKRIRCWEKKHGIGTEKKVKVVMLTGSESKGAFLNSFSEGCEAYIMKPFDLKKIDDVLKKLGMCQHDLMPL